MACMPTSTALRCLLRGLAAMSAVFGAATSNGLACNVAAIDEKATA